MSASNSPSKDHPRRCLHHMPPILWTDTAYMSLFGMTPEEMGRLCLRAISAVSQVKQVSTSQGGGPISEHRQRGTEELDLLRYLERRVAWMRIVLLVGWTGESAQTMMNEHRNEAHAKRGNDGRLIVFDVVG